MIPESARVAINKEFCYKNSTGTARCDKVRVIVWQRPESQRHFVSHKGGIGHGHQTLSISNIDVLRESKDRSGNEKGAL
jgi:hypothetical protein